MRIKSCRGVGSGVSSPFDGGLVVADGLFATSELAKKGKNHHFEFFSKLFACGAVEEEVGGMVEIHESLGDASSDGVFGPVLLVVLVAGEVGENKEYVDRHGHAQEG